MENPGNGESPQPEASTTEANTTEAIEESTIAIPSPTTPPPTPSLRPAPPRQEPLRLSATERWLIRTFDGMKIKRPWYKLPTWVAVLNFVALREQLRSENLHDTNALATYELPPTVTISSTVGESVTGQSQPPAAPDTTIRTQIGDYNDPSDAQMGVAMSRFGRNFPFADSYPEDEVKLLQPSPRLVSQTLFRRDSFVPATTLNLLAAAWIQFQTHDWFNHGDAGEVNEWKLPVADDDPWYERTMRVPRTPADPTRADNGKDGPPTFLNKVSHWWDASSIYGSDAATLASLRTFEDGKMIVENNMLRLNPTTGIPMTGFTENWWVGLTLLHTLFTLEHNAICDRLRQAYPTWKDERLFQVARLINAALMAKIHTVEWTPGILAHPALQIGMRANWWGLAGERLYRLFGRISRSDVISGIVGSDTAHHGAPYALTEEFTSVYRLHPLLPDELTFRSTATGNDLQQVGFMEMAEAEAGRLIAQGLSMTDVAYTFGTRHPGAIQLHNYPRFLQDLTRPNGQRLDVGAVDILRDRERGVPRYNRFRELVHKPRVTSFDELTTNKLWAKEIAEVYEGNLDRVDLMVGLFAEPTPPGFGFSDTAFRIFILMASRRLKSDRFFTVDYRPEIYTPEGMKWIDDNTMGTVLVRHYPQLQPFLSRVKNAFAPWPR
jgi:hypothetical protein